jgi:orotate phosphoribosyltransferase-like protein
MGDNAAMSSEDDVLRLHGEGLSIRAIANELGLSKSTVHRIILAAADDADLYGAGEDDDDLDDRELALLDARADPYQPTPRPPTRSPHLRAVDI